jgi:PEP-CTERM motif
MRFQSGRLLVRLALVAGLAGAGAAAQAVNLNQTDTFETGLLGWSTGAFHPDPPRVEADGGPQGAGDAWLRISALGGLGPGSRLAAFSGPQWSGDYGAAGVAGITMDANNLGDTDLALRLLFQLDLAIVTSQPVVLSAHSGWTSVFFSLSPADLIGLGPAGLAPVSQFRLVNQPASTGLPVQQAALLGIDNVLATAVPEPATTALFALGLLALVGQHRWRRRGAAPSRNQETAA